MEWEMIAFFIKYTQLEIWAWREKPEKGQGENISNKTLHSFLQNIQNKKIFRKSHFYTTMENKFL